MRPAEKESTDAGDAGVSPVGGGWEGGQFNPPPKKKQKKPEPHTRRHAHVRPADKESVDAGGAGVSEGGDGWAGEKSAPLLCLFMVRGGLAYTWIIKLRVKLTWGLTRIVL